MRTRKKFLFAIIAVAYGLFMVELPLLFIEGALERQAYSSEPFPEWIYYLQKRIQYIIDFMTVALLVLSGIIIGGLIFSRAE